MGEGKYYDNVQKASFCCVNDKCIKVNDDVAVEWLGWLVSEAIILSGYRITERAIRVLMEECVIDMNMWLGNQDVSGMQDGTDLTVPLKSALTLTIIGMTLRACAAFGQPDFGTSPPDVHADDDADDDADDTDTPIAPRTYAGPEGYHDLGGSD